LINASGKIVTPGLVDMHVHLHEPDYEHQETIQSGCHTAAWGGFTAVWAMPNTNPVSDNPAVTQAVLERAAQAQLARGYPVAAITKKI
jgi:dihydroorotase